MRLKARGMAQHGDPPGWLEESDPAGCDFLRDGRSMPPALTVHSACPNLGLIYILLNIHKTLSCEEGMAWYSSRPMPSLWLWPLLMVKCTSNAGRKSIVKYSLIFLFFLQFCYTEINTKIMNAGIPKI
jgi:hypothetical protein